MKRHYPCDLEAKQLIVEIGKRMYAKNMVAANDGNISVKVADDMIWATPTGVSKGFMKEDELVKMKLDGTIVSMGRLKPSSEIKMHLRVYNENPEIGAVTHAHPPVCTGFAIAGIALDKAIYSEALINLGAVPCVHYENPGSQALADAVAPYCRDYNGVLLANHGALSWGRDLMEAYFRLESMEHYAMVTMLTGSLIGKANALSAEQVNELLEIRRGLGYSSGGASLRTAAASGTEETDASAHECACPDPRCGIMTERGIRRLADDVAEKLKEQN